MKRQYQDLLEEVEIINNEVTVVRKQLWEAQDQLKEKEEKIRTLENHVNELLECRERDEENVKMLKEANTTLVEEEAKLREAMDMMKQVLTRSELKAKEDQETISRLEEERSLLSRKPLGVRFKQDEDAMEHIRHASEEQVRRLKLMLHHAEKEIEMRKHKHYVANKLVETLRAQITAMDDPSGTVKELNKQKNLVRKLEQQIIELEEDTEDEEEERDDDIDQEVINRAWFDEDLESSGLRAVVNMFSCNNPKVVS